MILSQLRIHVVPLARPSFPQTRTFFGINIEEIASAKPVPKPLFGGAGRGWDAEEWQVVTDHSIGGESEAVCEAGDGGGIVFKGTTSLELRQESRASKSG